MNDKVNKLEKLKKFKKFRINKELLKKAKKDILVLHCLPRGNEISEQVFQIYKNQIWQQAYNRICVQKSILLYCFNKLR